MPPVSAIQVVRILVRLSDDDLVYGRLARRLVRRLISADGMQCAAAFQKILQWSDNQLSLRPEMRDLPSWIRLAVGWTCAHRIYMNCVAARAPASELERIFGERAEQLAPDWLERRPDYWFDISHPRRVTPVALLVAGITSALGSRTDAILDDETRELLARFASMDIDKTRLPHWELLRDSRLASDGLNSYLAGDFGEKLRPVVGVDRASDFSQATIKRLTEEAFGKLSDAEAWTSSWMILVGVIGDLTPYADLVDQMSAAMREVNFAELSGRNLSIGTLAIHTAAVLTSHLSDQTLRDYVREEMRNVSSRVGQEFQARGVANNEPTDGDAERIDVRMADAALNASISPEATDEQVMKCFVQLMIDIAQRWPSSISMYKQFIRRMCEQLPPKLSAHLWSLLVRLRADEV